MKIEYKGKVYLSDAENVSEEQKQSLVKIIEYAAQGKANYLSLTINGNQTCFPEKILSESVISLIIEV